MAIEPKNTREHIISLYGHVTGLKKDISQIKNNHLKHIHEDVEKLGGKIDKIYWVLLTVAEQQYSLPWKNLLTRRKYAVES